MAYGLQKLEMAEAFLETAMLIEGPYLLESNSREEVDARASKLRWQKKKVCHFLYAMVFELAIKIMWEVENSRESEHIHNILQIYKELSRKKRSKIRQLYDTQVSEITNQVGQRNGARIRVEDLTEFQSLKQALKANYATVIAFKYHGLYKGKSSVIGGVIWNEDVEQIYIFPERFVIFPKEIVKYARESVESQTM